MPCCLTRYTLARVCTRFFLPPLATKEEGEDLKIELKINMVWCEELVDHSTVLFLSKQYI
jgi:hypothetical protein